VFQSKGSLVDYHPGSEIYTTLTQDKWTYVEAEAKLDQLILQKIKQGFVSIQQFSEPSDSLQFGSVRLISLDEKHHISLSEDSMNSVCNWMIDKQWLDKNVGRIDLSRWSRRAMRKAGLTNEIETDDDFDKYMQCWLQMSLKDRSQSTGEAVAAFKLNSDYWVINSDECSFLSTKILDYEKKQGLTLPQVINEDVVEDQEGDESGEEKPKKPKKISSRKIEQYRFFQFIKNCKEVGFTVRKAHVTLYTVKKNVSPYFDSNGDAHAPYINLDEDSYYELIDMLRQEKVLLEYNDDDIRYGEYDLNDIAIEDLGDADAELIEKLLLMSSKKDEVIQILQDKGITTSQVNFAEKFTNEWRKKTKKIRQSSDHEGIIPEYKLTDTNFWIINPTECSLLSEYIPFDRREFMNLLDLAYSKDGLVVQFLD
jgi:hypothetical protein